MTHWSADIPGAVALSSAFLALLGAAEFWARRGRPDPEQPRKLVHLGGGLLSLLFPVLIHSLWVVLAMALLLTGLFALGARAGFLKSLHSVSRSSRGSEYYPLAVFLVFVMAWGKYWMYVAALLSLAVADAFAALVGSRYGRVRYQVEDADKSLEGSLVFLVIAFLAVQLPCLLMTDLPRDVVVLTALLAAVLLTAFEAISLKGADNLFVPVAVCVILQKNVFKPAPEVAYQVACLAAIALALGFLAVRSRSFNTGGRIAFVLFAYGVWALGSWQYGLPVFTGFGLLLLLGLWLPAPQGHVPGIRVRVLSRILLAPFLLVVLANATGRYDLFFGPFLAACATVLAMSLWTWVRWRKALGPGARWPGVLLADELCLGRNPDMQPEKLWNARRFLFVLGAAGLVAGLQEMGLMGLWQPAH